ncbi:hypothetical protein BASA50_008317 [Batrachochytrium salamandrivorans]|uniref:Uncharacterized protein n=1 Tax=Batrachochytrium salamandrivorans TaxID=1357716 RepID=A0ABQ8F4I2_9FUNG|nr:hypothetical protein BASA60_000243 [Batrachochytrium salamandrivorans]KAH6574155.1 hypothetical protein BASA62_002592 [Batrachochytrium salamandrivorans]KAH6587109.1 hypothetical protein BASA61_006411 [Batrachochytrium salamandrivorans]KAH6592034.1 hypothetical protein BASA50_008317 [Batrachochytrium salamandrivorans]KAH9248700.1 hypothetical protein BASA81_013634 [Batrachochytrium salamandrivorans]
MRVRVLVAAAMVITSANAIWLSTFMSCFGYNGRSEPVLSPALTENKSDTPQSLKPIKGKPIGHSNMDSVDKESKCESIVSDLFILWDKAASLSYKLQEETPIFYKLIKKNGRNIEKDRKSKKSKKNKKGEKGEKSEDSVLQTNEMVADSVSHGESQTKVVKYVNDLTALKTEYSGLWAELKTNNCPTKSTYLLSPEEMIDNGYLLC